jgi:hypothetical protein
MPNFDGGHYFLTALIPISTNILVEKDGQRFSPIQVVRKALATLPTARQTWASQRTGLNSPFSRNLRTHFARFVVVEDTMYNGRDPQDAIEAAVSGMFIKVNPVIPQPQDVLSSPFLLFVADFDAASGELGELTSYLETLWQTMQPELREILVGCVDFDSVQSGAGFAKYIQRGQIETTMSFNDYWIFDPPLKSSGILLAMVVVGLIVIGGIGGAIAGGVVRFIIGLSAGLVSGLLTDYFVVMYKGSQPFPTAPNTDLPSILKALYLQQKFTQFAIDMQGADDAALQLAFAVFLAHHKPTADEPRQLPGVVHS